MGKIPLPEDYNKQLEKTQRQISVLTAATLEAFNRFISEGFTVTESIRKAFKFVNYKEALIDIYINTSVETMAINDVIVVDLPLYTEWRLGTLWPEDGFNISKTVSNHQIQISKLLRERFNAGDTWIQTARKLRNKDILKADIPKTLKDLINKARKAQLSPADMKRYKTAMNKSLRQVESLALNDAPNIQLKNAYNNLIKQTQTFNDKAIQKAVDRALRNRAQYLAERIARTEIARANAVSEQILINNDKLVVGWKSLLSTRHVINDICTIMANANLYGMGPGVYPRSVNIQIPYHNNCLCRPKKIYKKDVDRARFSNKRGQEYLKEHPIIARKIMTKKQYENYINDSSSWQENIYNMPDFNNKLPLPPNSTYILDR